MAVIANMQNPSLIKKPTESVPPMPEDEEVVPKDTVEWAKHHGIKAVWSTLNFIQTQPIVTLIIGLIFIYLLGINRKLDRLEHSLGQLIELHK
jgi:hypothetical protein